MIRGLKYRWTLIYITVLVTAILVLQIIQLANG